MLRNSSTIWEQNISIMWIVQDKVFMDYHLIGITTKDTWIFLCLTIIDALKRLQYNKKQPPRYSTHTHLPIIYGKVGQRQYITSPDTSQILTSQETTQVQSVLGTCLYDVKAIYGTMSTSINDIGTQQAKPTKNTQLKIKILLNYADTYPHVKLRCHASDIILQVESDAAYLVLQKSRSRRLGNKLKINDNNISIAQYS